MRKIIVLIGRSGCGKSAIAGNLIKDHGYKSVRTATTRSRRDGESQDTYYFMSKEEFLRRKDDNEFVEWDVYADNCYGTLKKEFETEENLVIVMTPEGAEAIKKIYPEAFVVYVETDLKTSVMRAIAREENVDPAKIQKIAIRASTDDFLFHNPKCDTTLPNPVGAKLVYVVQTLLRAYDNWLNDLELLSML